MGQLPRRYNFSQSLVVEMGWIGIEPRRSLRVVVVVVAATTAAAAAAVVVVVVRLWFCFEGKWRMREADVLGRKMVVVNNVILKNDLLKLII